MDLAPSLDRVVSDPRDVIFPGGRAILYEKRSWEAGESAPPGTRGHLVAEGVYRVVMENGVVSRAGFEPRSGASSSSPLWFGGSPDGKSVVVAQTWTEAPPHGAPTLLDTRVTLSLATFEGEPAREICTTEGSLERVRDGVAVQWSPDGLLVAVGLAYPNPPSYRWAVTIFDAISWNEVARFPDTCLAGSACWGPDSDRLLVEYGPDDTWIQHLNGDRQPISVLPAAGTSDMRPIRPAGLAGNDHLLTFQQRGKRLSIALVALTDGSSEVVVAWTGSDFMYPVLASMPSSVWSDAALASST